MSNPDEDTIVTRALRESAEKAGFTHTQSEFLIGLYISLVDLVRLTVRGDERERNKWKTLDDPEGSRR
jgi:hypothetical protein